MKNKRFLEERIESILMKRYALEKIIPFKKFLGVLALTLVSYVVFFTFWISWVERSKDLHFTSFKSLCIYIIVLSSILVIGFGIWKMIGSYIPKFVFIGLVGWFLISGGLIPNILVPGEIRISESENNPANSIQLPATRFLGVHEDSKRGNWDKLSNNPVYQLEKWFLSPAVNELEQPLNQNDEAKSRFLQTLNSPEFTSLRLLGFFLLLLVLGDLYLTITRFGKAGKRRIYFSNLSWKKREFAVKSKICIMVFLLVGLFFLTMNYFFILLALLVLINIFLIKWEIEQRGQNHKIYTRSVLFLFLIQFFSIAAGEIFFLLYLPVFMYIKDGVQVLSQRDAVLLNWIIIVGSLASVLIGITTQVVWSGKRLTEKLDY